MSLTPVHRVQTMCVLPLICIGICTSDVHVLHGAMHMPDGNIVGHEFTGRVEACGSAVDDLAVGQRVICELAKGACLVCETCTSGHYEFCPQKQPPGWASQGIYASHTIQPRYCVHPIADSVPAAVAALAEPVAICVYGLIERARVDRDWKTVIYGMGPIGLLSVLVLRDLGMQDITVVFFNTSWLRPPGISAAIRCNALFTSRRKIFLNYWARSGIAWLIVPARHQQLIRALVYCAKAAVLSPSASPEGTKSHSQFNTAVFTRD